MSNKVLSVSIAAYNVDKYLTKTLDSLIGEEETLESIEIIVVNDGSTDTTIQLAEKYQNRFPDSIIVIDKTNGGYGSTINSSLNVATGKYFKLLDGDDWFTENICSFIKSLEDTEADLVITPYYQYTNELVLVDNHSETPETMVPIANTSIGDLLFAMHELAIRTNTLKDYYTPISEHTFYTDTEFVFNCIRAAKTVIRINTPVYCYRLGLEGQSVSLTGLRKHFRDFKTVAKKIYSGYEEIYKSENGKKKEILEYIVRTITYNTYKSYMLLENPMEYKDELMEFDKEIKCEYPVSYAIGNSSKSINILRKSRFLLYNPICKYEKNKFNCENR